MQNHIHSNVSNVSTGRDPQPAKTAISHALNTQETFTRAQVAWLMSQAMRWGYENRVAEENAAYPPEPVFTCGKWYDQAAERKNADARARLPRPGDFQGVQAEAPPLRVAA